MCAVPAVADDDAYLRALDAEVTKVEAPATDTAPDGDRAAPAVTTDAAATATSREHFEALLRQQHVGTYSFYRRLPERSREEIFLDFENGASLETLRGKIVDRYLNR